MTSDRQKKICVFVLICYILLPCNSFAQNSALTNIIVTNTRDDLLVYLTVEGAFREKMKKAILSGVPTTFSFLFNYTVFGIFGLIKRL